MYENAKAVAVGWGTTDSSTGEQPDVLQHVGVETMPNDDCGYYEFDMVTENMICAGSEGKDSCYGDSGGKKEGNFSPFQLKDAASDHDCSLRDVWATTAAPSPRGPQTPISFRRCLS